MKITIIMLCALVIVGGCRNKEVDRITTELELYSLNHRAVVSHHGDVAKEPKAIIADINSALAKMPSASRERKLLGSICYKLNEYTFELEMQERDYLGRYDKGLPWRPEDEAQLARLADASRADTADVARLLRTR